MTQELFEAERRKAEGLVNLARDNFHHPERRMFAGFCQLTLAGCGINIPSKNALGHGANSTVCIVEPKTNGVIRKHLVKITHREKGNSAKNKQDRIHMSGTYIGMMVFEGRLRPKFVSPSVETTQRINMNEPQYMHWNDESERALLKTAMKAEIKITDV
jgi:hypothetical protein